MADTDLSLLVGELRGGVTAIKEAVADLKNRNDERFDQLEAKHEADKQGAIARAAAQHADQMTVITAVGVKASNNETWINEHGKPLEVRVGAVEVKVNAMAEADAAKKSEAKGQRKAYGFIWGLITAAVTLISAVFGPDAVEYVKRITGHGG